MALVKPIEIQKSSGLGNLFKVGAGIASGGALGGLGAATGAPVDLISGGIGKLRDWFRRPISTGAATSAGMAGTAMQRRLGQYMTRGDY